MATQVQIGDPPGLPVFLHFPAAPNTVQLLPALHNDPPGLEGHVPAISKPALCRKPGNPLNLEQTPTYSLRTSITARPPEPAAAKVTAANRISKLRFICPMVDSKSERYCREVPSLTINHPNQKAHKVFSSRLDFRHERIHPLATNFKF